MARIPDALIARLKEQVSLQRLVEGRGVVAWAEALARVA